ncbi:MAG: hypothetical protein COA78_19665 [Blastopirellula sp.]|nr:MAG: hypothetical protein COA78_19665 [Blastopirellula sp.]
MTQEKLDALLKPLIKNAIKMTPHADENAESASCESKFGGLPYAEENDSWPCCPRCKNDLTFIVQLKSKAEDTLFVFYYCVECFPWGLGDEEKGLWVAKFYTSTTMDRYALIQPSSELEYPVIPCRITESDTTVLPDWDGVDSLSGKVTDLCSEINEESPWEAFNEAIERSGTLETFASLLGGYPRHVQSEISCQCTKCNSEMEFFAQIDSEEEAGIMWGDVGLVYFFRCSEHKDEVRMELQCH